MSNSNNTRNPKLFFTLFLKDAALFFALIAISGIIGLVFNSLRQNGVTFPYRTKLERFSTSINASEESAEHRLCKISVEHASKVSASRAAVFIDVRPAAFFDAGHISGAISRPSEQLNRHEGIAKLKATIKLNTPIVVYCENNNCDRGGHVWHLLKQNGYQQVCVLDGGYSAWKSRYD